MQGKAGKDGKGTRPPTAHTHWHNWHTGTLAEVMEVQGTWSDIESMAFPTVLCIVGTLPLILPHLQGPISPVAPGILQWRFLFRIS